MFEFRLQVARAVVPVVIRLLLLMLEAPGEVLGLQGAGAAVVVLLLAGALSGPGRGAPSAGSSTEAQGQPASISYVNTVPIFILLIITSSNPPVWEHLEERAVERGVINADAASALGYRKWGEPLRIFNVTACGDRFSVSNGTHQVTSLCIDILPLQLYRFSAWGAT